MGTERQTAKRQTLKSFPAFDRWGEKKPELAVVFYSLSWQKTNGYLSPNLRPEKRKFEKMGKIVIVEINQGNCYCDGVLKKGSALSLASKTFG